MAASKTAYKLLINAGSGKNSEAIDLEADAKKPARIKAQAGGKYQLQDVSKNGVAPEQVRIKRVGKDLHVSLGEGEATDLIVEDYYTVMPEGYNGLIGQAENGSFYEYVLETPESGSYLLRMV